MKPMTATLCLVLVSLLACSGLAAPKAGRAGPVMRGVAVLRTSVEAVTDLSDQQKSDTKSILDQAESQLASIRDSVRAKGQRPDATERKALRQQIQEVLLNAKTEIESKLSDEQKVAFREALRVAREALVKERAGRLKNRKNGANV